MKEVSLDDAIAILKNKMRSHRYADSVKEDAKTIFRDLEKYRKLAPKDLSDKQILEAYIAMYKTPKHKNSGGDFPRRVAKTVGGRLLDICNGKEIVWKRGWLPKEYDLTHYYETALNMITKRADKQYTVQSALKIKSDACRFFSWLQDRGVGTLKVLNKNDIIAYLEFKNSKSHYTGICAVRWALKIILRYLNELGYTDSDFSEIFFMSPTVKTRILPPADIDEVIAMIRSLDRSTIIGKRNYAILLLVLTTGMRRSDIANLSLSSINWAEGEINVIQQKTGRAITYPLTKDVAGALLDYIENGRPKMPNTDKLFLTLRAPYTPITPTGLGMMYSDLFKRVIKKPDEPRIKTLHSIRRLFAKRMVEGGAPLIVASKALGHQSIHPTSRYISYDSEGLRSCGLDLNRTLWKENK